MALEPLATLADLTELGIAITPAPLVDSLLTSVSAEIREAAGVMIGPKSTSTIKLTGGRERYLAIPATPVRSVSLVLLDGAAVSDWRLTDGRLWRACGWASDEGPSEVTVTLEHGLDEVPADIVRLACMLVAAGLAASTDGFEGHRGKQYTSIDDYREGYLSGAEEVVDPAEIPDRTRAMLRRRFGGGVYETGTY